LLLAVLEYQSGWVSLLQPESITLDYPMRFYDPNRRGLYRQLSWAANQLNRGYYLWKVNGISHWQMADGGLTPADATLNAGTAGVQHLMAWLHPRPEWEKAVGSQGIFAVFYRFFGYPFDYAIEPLLPPGLQQPPMQLPFEVGKVWSFTGGPHGGWGDGSAWAGLDFAPPNGGLGCVISDEWVVAVADGVVVRSETGVVVIDMDGDGYEQTGWNILYLHLATANRAPLGMRVKAGDRIGHPSCEGGLSSGTHVHLARKFNGEWIPADREIPFVLDGWISSGDGVEYNGKLIKDGVIVEAWNRLVPENQISR
ncbi:MAG: peptidoglycan DD-metalloendopeptidase family protein, partial [Chloroflexota bacterium]